MEMKNRERHVESNIEIGSDSVGQWTFLNSVESLNLFDCLTVPEVVVT